MHTLAFEPAGTVEMVDGVGQVLNTLVRGRFTVERVSPIESLVRLTDLVEINPYYKHRRFRGLEREAYLQATQGYVPHEEHDVRRRLDLCSVRVTCEEGPFLLRQQVIWKISDAREWPYLLCPERYRFASDPLAQLAANRQGNLYYLLETPETDANVYYRRQDVQRLTAREVAERGIVMDAEHP